MGQALVVHIYVLKSMMIICVLAVHDVAIQRAPGFQILASHHHLHCPSNTVL